MDVMNSDMFIVMDSVIGKSINRKGPKHWRVGHKFVPFLAQYIRGQRERIGGDFIVAHAVSKKKDRDQVRKEIPDCIFINLILDRATQKKRLAKRSGTDYNESLDKLFKHVTDGFQKAKRDEPNTYDLCITEDMSTEDVITKIEEILSQERDSSDGQMEKKSNLCCLL